MKKKLSNKNSKRDQVLILLNFLIRGLKDKVVVVIYNNNRSIVKLQTHNKKSNLLIKSLRMVFNQ